MSLNDIKSGKSCKIKAINATDILGQRLLDMGFIEGTSITVMRQAPLKDPIELKIHGYLVALRRNEAKLIEVE
ncbi:MAG: ferrous iron transport protein A [Campylobacter sp.]|nr:ferrous iron transport protein A [Campylobacter sp.]